MASSMIHPDVYQFPVCGYAGRIRKEAGDRFCRHPELGRGTPCGVMTCLACVHAGTTLAFVISITPRIGDAIAELLKQKLGAEPTKTCNCENYIEELNRRGERWCRENVDSIVSRILKEGEKQQKYQQYPLWIKRWYLKRLVNRAINVAVRKTKTS